MAALKGVRGLVQLGHDGCAGARALVGDANFDRCFKFGIIRDPWERMVSLYHHDRRSRQGFKESNLEEKQAGFEPWLEADLYPRLWKSARDMWFEDGKLALDYVGRFEDLGGALTSVHTRLETRPNLRAPLTILNASLTWSYAHDDYVPYYQGRAREIVQELCQWEIEEFSYPFKTDPAKSVL